jgi:hypothetical protein
VLSDRARELGSVVITREFPTSLTVPLSTECQTKLEFQLYYSLRQLALNPVLPFFLLGLVFEAVICHQSFVQVTKPV